jgi:alkanesulfonate monooxygenase SsuD/methylene tetrahydromethanopterin reductase-like flavin-dependent oxidoreductase (luciferase family)
VLRNTVEQAVLADSFGVDAITLGEHHRDDFAISSPEIVLAAIAGRTERILLGTGVTVLSSDDPVRVYERFATLDGVSGGRAEVILGRGSFTESFPLFGYQLSDYDTLFSEKLDLFAKLRGDPARFLPFAKLYRDAQQQLGADHMPLGVHSPGHVAETDEQAREELWQHFAANRNRIGRERGWPETTRGEFEHEADNGSLYVGSPETVAQKIASTVRTLGADRFDLKYSNGTMPHEQLMSSIELFGSAVMPRVRELLGE